MIFRQKLIDRIKDGTKTQHRLPVNGHTTDREHDICKVKPTRSYPVHTVSVVTEDDGYGNERKSRVVGEHGLLIVTAVRRQQLDALSVEEAKAEGFVRKGFGDREAFFDYWREEHGTLAGDVWVVEFEADLHAPRYLRTGSGYTFNVAQAIDPLPAVPPEYQAQLTSNARLADDLRAARHQIEWERQGLAARLAGALDQADREGRDVGRLKARAEAAVTALERELKRRAA